MHQHRFGLDVQSGALLFNFSNIFKWVFEPARTINEFPAIANTPMLVSVLKAAIQTKQVNIMLLLGRYFVPFHKI